MKTYVKSSVREKPDNLILHVGTNDLDSDKSSEIIAKAVVDVASSRKKKFIGVSISN